MIKLTNAASTVSLVLFLFTCSATAGEKPGSFSPYVDTNGSIILPSDFRSSWAHLGTWVVTSTAAAGQRFDQSGPGAGIHTVWTQEGSLKAYKNKKTWPDGTAIVMEVRAIAWDDMPTGHVIVEGEVVRWLVMVKDGKGRFPKNPNWGDGWGWALFTPSSQKGNFSADYKADCLSCHETVKTTDRVFIHGYPVLR